MEAKLDVYTSSDVILKFPDRAETMMSRWMIGENDRGSNNENIEDGIEWKPEDRNVRGGAIRWYAQRHTGDRTDRK